MTSAWIIIIILLSLINHIFLIRYINRSNRDVSIASGLLFSIIVYFHVTPLLLFTVLQGKAQGIFTSVIINEAQNNLLPALLIINIFSITLTFFSKKRITYGANKQAMQTTKECNKVLHFFARASIIVGAISFCLYVLSFGGLQNLLSKAAYVRSFSIDTSSYVSGISQLLIVPARLLMAAPILLYATKTETNKKSDRIMFVISLILAAIFLLFNSGKTQIVQFAMPFIIIVMSGRTKHPWLLTILIGVLCLPILGVLDSLFHYIGYGEWLSSEISLASYIEQFSYPLANTLQLNKLIEISGLHFFSIIPLAILNLIPGISTPQMYEYTSTLYNGVNWRNYYGVPADIISVSYMQLGLIGIIISAILLGILSSAIQESMKNKHDKDMTYRPILWAVVSLMFSFTVDADLGAMIKGNYLLYLGIICLLCSNINKGRAR